MSDKNGELLVREISRQFFVHFVPTLCSYLSFLSHTQPFGSAVILLAFFSNHCFWH